MRKLSNYITPVEELKKDGDQYVLTTHFPMKSYSIKFKPGDEVSYERIDGRKVTSIFTIRGNVIYEDQKIIRENAKVERIFKNDELVVVSISFFLNVKIFFQIF